MKKKIKEIFNEVFIANKFDGIFTSNDIVIEAMRELLKLYEKQKQEIKKLKNETEMLRGFFKNTIE